MSDSTLAPESAVRRSQWIRWPALLFSWVCIALVILGLLEIGLRLAGFGHSTRLFLKRHVEGQTVYVTNKAFYQQFYTAPIPWGKPNEFGVSVPKPPNTYRIFILGSSAAEGVPDYTVSFWRCLDAMLRAQYPATNFELCNLAMSGSNSHVMRAAAQASVQCQPDLFVVYMGNNERNGLIVKKIASEWEPWSLGLPMIRANVFLSDLRLAQLFPKRLSTMKEEEERYSHLAYKLEEEKVYQYFAANLQDICQAGSRSGAKVLLCTVGTRLREWMVESTHLRALSNESQTHWENEFRAGIAAEDAHDLQGALGHYLQAAQVDDSYAELSYRMANCYWNLEEYEKAGPCFILAKEQDAAHNRANRRINAIIRETAAARKEEGVFCVEAEGALAGNSPHGVPGPELFLDFAHMTVDGNYVVAKAVLEQVTAVLPDWIRAQAKDGKGVLSNEECKRRLAFSLPQEKNIISLVLRPNQKLYHQSQTDLEKRAAELDQLIGNNSSNLIENAYRSALELDGRDAELRERYAAILRDRGDTAGELEQLRGLLAASPYSYTGMSAMIEALERSGDHEAALHQAERFAAVYPGWYAFSLKGNVLANMNRFEEALRAFRKAFKATPLPGVKQSVGTTLLRMGRLDDAIHAFREAVQIDAANPDSRNDPARWTRHADLARALTRKEEFRAAVQAFRAALEVNPNDAGMRRELVEVFCKMGDSAAAVQEADQCRKMGIALPPTLLEPCSPPKSQ